MISAFFDESTEGDGRKNGILAVAGYALDDAGLKAFAPEWQAMLVRYRIPYFHMTECNAPAPKRSSNVFAHLSEAECDQCAREAIALAKKYPLHGYAAVLDQRVFKEILQDEGFDCDAYSFLVWTVAIHVIRWVRENRPEEQIELFFEQGYKTDKVANNLLNASRQDRLFKGRVVSHAFVYKQDIEPAQAGDLITWNIRSGYERIANGRKIRGDTRELFKDRIVFTIEYTPNLLGSIRNDFVKRAGSLQEAAKTLFSSDDLESFAVI